LHFNSSWALSAAQVLTDRFCIALAGGALDGHQQLPREAVHALLAHLAADYHGHFPFTLSAADLLACTFKSKSNNQ
jgi:hypothetical protein